MNSDIKWSYFQYQKDMQLPVFIKFDSETFGEELAQFLVKYGFSKLSDGEGAEAEAKINMVPNARLLTISEASAVVAKQIEVTSESDRFGMESINPKNGYKVYRYKDLGLMIYSYGASQWQLGTFSDFGGPDFEIESRTVLLRFLSWSLAPLGIIGFWGTNVDEGLVVMRQAKANNEAVFIDMKSKNIISVDGVTKMKSRFKIVRLDSTLRGRNVRMSREELISFLSHHTSFFDYNNMLSVAVRQMIQTMATRLEGVLHPEESFRPRTDLSL